MYPYHLPLNVRALKNQREVTDENCRVWHYRRRQIGHIGVNIHRQECHGIGFMIENDSVLIEHERKHRINTTNSELNLNACGRMETYHPHHLTGHWMPSCWIRIYVFFPALSCSNTNLGHRLLIYTPDCQLLHEKLKDMPTSLCQIIPNWRSPPWNDW